ncbi:diguanylate cyclase [uncultured Ilyobacter sp.]|uniref:sensor domain-containing diguanylate cyclase n=1 Tax=uncultured Ilyobacter sp. TaxID=544433 RepID=UPI002AA8A232|nr:diguanylate cyclase [uncultured Ilyobacter sp.]
MYGKENMEKGILKEQNNIFKTLGILAVVIILLTRFFIVEPRLRDFRHELDSLEVTRVESIFSKDINTLKRNLSTHSIWFDLHKAVSDKDIKFLKNYFDPTYLTIFKLDYIGFFDLSKKEIWSVKNSRHYFETGEFIDNMSDSLIKLKWNDNFKDYKSIDLISYNGKSYIYGVHHILDNIHNKAPAGYLFFLREIDSKYIDELSEGTGFDFTFVPLKDIEKPKNERRPPPPKKFGFRPDPGIDRTIFIPFYGYDNNLIFAVDLKLNDPIPHNKTLMHLTEAILVAVIVSMVLLTNLRIRTIIRPIINLHKHIENISDLSGLKPLVHKNKKNEIDSVIHSFNKMIKILEKRDLELKNQNCVLADMVYIDTLTGVGSRRLLQNKIPEDFRDAAEKGELISIAMIDVDHFKLYNDTYGHIQGDTVLMKIGEMLKSTFYNSDFIMRYGGEEFMIFSRGEAAHEINRFINEFVINLRNEKLEHSKGIGGIVTASVGICSVIPDINDDLEEFIKLADLKLYRAKETGRNKIISYKKR